MKNTIVKIENVELLITESEKYMQINDISEEKIAIVWERISTDYPGYEVFFSFNSERMAVDQKVPVQFLARINAKIVDDTLNFRLKKENFSSEVKKELEIVQLTEADFDEFSQFHDSRNPDFFWTNKRIKERLSIWQIHILKEKGQLSGYVMTMIKQRNLEYQAEIFAIEVNNESEFKTLLSTTCQSAFAIGKTEILYMIEKTAPARYQEIAVEIGFKETGFYQGFRTFLPV